MVFVGRVGMKKDWKKLRVYKNEKKGKVRMTFEIDVTPRLKLVGLEHRGDSFGGINYSFDGVRCKYVLTYDKDKQWIISLITDDENIPKDVAEEFDSVVREEKIMSVLNEVISEGFRRCGVVQGW